MTGEERLRLAERIIRNVMEMTRPSGSGGYWADFGPLTYAWMLEFTGTHSDGTIADG